MPIKSVPLHFDLPKTLHISLHFAVNMNPLRKENRKRNTPSTLESCTEIIATIVHYKAEVFTIVYEF